MTRDVVAAAAADRLSRRSSLVAAAGGESQGSRVTTSATSAVDRVEWSFMCATFLWVPTPTRRGWSGAGGPSRFRLAVDGARPSARTLVDITEATRSSPMMMLMTLTVTLSQAQRAGDDADQQDAGDDAVQAPRPPKIETPPSSTAAMTWSSSPVALSPRALPKRSV